MKSSAFCIAAVLGLFSLSTQAANVATVNGKPITDADLNKALGNVGAATNSDLNKDPNNRTTMLNNLIDQEILIQEARAKKIDGRKEYVEALDAFKKQLLVDGLLRTQVQGKVTDAAAKAYYEKNKIKYTGDQVHAMHILASSEKEAAALLAEASKPGADFQKIAESKSKDPSAKNNRGDIGYFPRGVLDQAFTEAAFGNKVGSIVGPVKTSFGYHVIKVVDRKFGKTPEYIEVEQRVRADLQKSLLDEYVAGLRKRAKITR